MTYEKLFYSGDYQKIDEKFKATTAAQLSSNELVFVIGALSFSSHIDQAEALLNSISQSDLAMATFFLAVGYTRNSDYVKAQKLLLNALANIKKNSTKDLFFYYQGLGFYRYFGARFKKAEAWATLAKNNITAETPQYFKLIHQDLMSHILLKRGRIHLGLKAAEEALQSAIHLKSKSSEEAILVSKTIYESQYLSKPEETLLKIEKLLKQFKRNSNYSYINLALEHVRRLNLTGELTKSANLLEEVKASVFAGSMNRQKAMWSFRFSHLCYLKNQVDQALSFIETSLSYLDSKVDLVLKVQILGLKYKISKRRGLNVLSLEDEIKSLTFLTQESTALSYAYRYGWIKKPNTEDAYSYFFHRWLKDGYKDYATLQSVLKKNWNSLLVDLLPEDRKNFIYLDIVPKKGILFFEDQIIFKDGITPLLRQALLLLKRGPCSKKAFVESIWGYQYDSYRHDPLIYTVINRLKEFMKPFSDQVYIQENQIYLQQTDVRVYEHLSMPPKTSLNDNVPEEVSNLNQRQYELLSYLKSHTAVSVSQACDYLHVSKITSCRDLTTLLKLKLVVKRGRARATTYSLRG